MQVFQGLGTTCFQVRIANACFFFEGSQIQVCKCATIALFRKEVATVSFQGVGRNHKLFFSRLRL
uniref:Predicted protein n=1 Tax=Hordeum vulgare subsp. vulgare TaxID=112509 RepID=F2CUJ2_HORVV|nr:predicted protein [Hordeum vulgare subsp. vulgare]